MEKIWQLMPKIDDEFAAANSDYNRIALQLLYNRGLKDFDSIKNFFSDDWDNLLDPFDFKDMREMVELVIKHIKAQSKITVYGDYDADGVTSSALLYDVLKIFKASVDVYLPDRASEGYGLNKSAIELIANQGTKLIITVDQGIRDKELISYAKSLGLEVAITDHHIPPQDKNNLPECLIINPAIEDDNYKFKFLAGVGVAFKLASALIRSSKLSQENKIILERSLLDLVAIGTVADCVNLLGENRLLVKKGLEVLNNTRRPGLKELIRAAQIENRKLESWNISFQIAPRLNAAGRLDHANTAFGLLASKDKNEIALLAEKLNSNNSERQKITEEIIAETEQQVSKQLNNKILIGICPIEKEEEAKIWNEGVIGLAAGKICEKYYKPAIIITKSGNVYKGSGRSIAEFNIIAAVEECKELLEKFGGHPMACGFSLLNGNIQKFKDKLLKIGERELMNCELKPSLKIDCELKMDEIDQDLIAEVDKFAPFGQDNPQPKFASFAVIIKDKMTMGFDNRHIKFRLGSFWAIAFGRAEELNDFKIGDKVDMVYTLEKNEFNGRSEVQMKLIDIRFNN